MNFNRRDLLKFFGAGTIIAPVAGSAPLARLIEVPKVEIFEATKIPEPLDICKVKSCKIHFTMDDGTKRSIEVGREWISRSGYKPFAPGVLTPAMRLKVDLWFDSRNGSSPDSAKRVAFLSGDVTL